MCQKTSQQKRGLFSITNFKKEELTSHPLLKDEMPTKKVQIFSTEVTKKYLIGNVVYTERTLSFSETFNLEVIPTSKFPHKKLYYNCTQWNSNTRQFVFSECSTAVQRVLSYLIWNLGII